MNAAPVLIVGAGPTGMTAALALAHYGIGCILLDEDHVLSGGSRAIAYSSDTLATWEKLGAAQAMLAKGVAWSVRHTYFRERELYTQNFPPPGPGFLPRFFNLQQYYVERYLLDRIEATPLIDLRWDHKVTGCREDAGGVILQVSTPAGEQEFKGQYVLACDGARSSMRKLLNLPFPGVTHKDHFLIADLRVDLQSPPEPRFFFDHPTNPGQTVLIHPQPDGVWRFDWQVGPEVDIQAERDPQRMDWRIRSLIGDLPYEIVWLSDYRFHQRILERFRHGSIFFLGDAAHLVAPFGARGMNSAVADVDNLIWKLVLVLKHNATDALLDTYQAERWPAQQHNQVVTNNTMLFMSPPNRWRRMLRNLILRLSAFSMPARRRVNSGKMVEPFTYTDSPLLIPDDAPASAWQGAPLLGSKAPDLPCVCWPGGGASQQTGGTSQTTGGASQQTGGASPADGGASLATGVNIPAAGEVGQVAGASLSTAGAIPMTGSANHTAGGAYHANGGATHMSGERKTVFLRSLFGRGFCVLYFAAQPADGLPFAQAACPRLAGFPVHVYTVVSQPPEQPAAEPLLKTAPLLIDEAGALQKAFAAQPGTLYLIRPDGHIAARRRDARADDLPSLLYRAAGLG